MKGAKLSSNIITGFSGICLNSHHSEPSYSCLSSQKSFPTTTRSRETSFPPYPLSQFLLAKIKNWFLSMIKFRFVPPTHSTSSHVLPCSLRTSRVSSYKHFIYPSSFVQVYTGETGWSRTRGVSNVRELQSPTIANYAYCPILAVEIGFEPMGILLPLVFKTNVINHSTTQPQTRLNEKFPLFSCFLIC